MTQLQKMLAKVKGTSEDQLDAEILALGQSVNRKVEAFLTNHDLAYEVNAESMQPNSQVSLEQVESEIDVSGEHSVEDLVEAAQIPDHLRGSAREQVALILSKFFNQTTGGATAFNAHRAPAQEGTNSLALDSVFSPEMVSELEGTTEGFGANINVTVPDIKTAITVSLMRFHMGLMPRMLPTQVTESATVVYKQPRVSVFDLTDKQSEPTPMLDLFEDPSMVSNELPQIVPLEANDSAEDDVLVQDSQIRFDKTADILDLSIDSSKPGYGKINHTDHVADGPRVDAVRVDITNSTLGATDTFDLTLPRDRNRMTRLADSTDSADRALQITHEWFLNSESEETDGTSSDLFSNAESTAEGIKVSLNVSVKINLKSGEVTGLASASLTKHRTDDADISDGFSDSFDSPTLDSYRLDARFSEENLRKTSIAVRQDSRSFSYDLPIGRHYVYDSALTQDVPESIPGNLSRVVQLGEDHIALSLTSDVLANVKNRNQEVEQGLSTIDVGRDYVAGCMVKPTVIQGTLTISDLNAMRDSDRSGDIKQRAISYLNSLTTQLLSESKLKEQLANGQNVVFRLGTSVSVLGCVIGQPHIHNHLSAGQQGSDSGGVEYRLQLPNGVILECVTTSFKSMENRMILVPHIEENPESVLNFGTVWDMGTLVGQLDFASDDGAHKRMYANARQLMIPSNPVGADIDVVGAYSVNEDAYSSL